MSTIDDKKKQFEQRLEALRSRHASQAPRPVLDAGAPFDAQLAAYDSWLEQRLALWRGEERPAPPPARAPEPSSVPEYARVETWASEVDQAALNEFDLARFPRRGGFARPTRLFARPEEFLRALGEGLELARAEREEFLANPPREALELQAVYLPSQGCLVNAARFVGLENDPQAQLKQDRDARVDALGAVVRARWGNGYLLEYSAFGQALQQEGLSNAWIMRQAGLRPPRLENAYNRLDAIGQGIQIAWTGWREWIWEYLACKMQRPLGEGLVVPRPSTRRIGELLTRVAALLPLSFTYQNLTIKVPDIFELFRYLFFQETRLAGQAANTLLLAAEAYCNTHDEDNQRRAGVRVRHLLGWYYLSGLEAAFSSYCVPYAMLIAFHVPSSLAQAAPEEIRRALNENPLLNPNTRLALLNGLNPAARYDPKALRLAAREIKLDAPEGYFV